MIPTTISAIQESVPTPPKTCEESTTPSHVSKPKLRNRPVVNSLSDQGRRIMALLSLKEGRPFTLSPRDNGLASTGANKTCSPKKQPTRLKRNLTNANPTPPTSKQSPASKNVSASQWRAIDCSASSSSHSHWDTARLCSLGQGAPGQEEG